MRKFHWIHEFVAPLTVVLFGLGIFFAWQIQSFSLGIVAFLSLYAFPLVLHRIQMFFTPIPLGATPISKGAFHPWLASHRIQKIYMLFPFLEAFLMLVPGLFSLWLRLWGSKVGENVYFAPSVRIHDRSLVHIGDNVIVGDETKLVSHIVTRVGASTRVICDPVVIHSHKLIGGYSILPAGAKIKDIKFLPSHSLCPVGSVDQYFSLSKFGMEKLQLQETVSFEQKSKISV